MKKIFGLALLLVAFLSFSKPALATEGTFKMVPRVGGEGRCFASSVYVDGMYRVLVTCRDLRVAVDAEANKYVVWSEVLSSGKKRRMGEILNGKLMANSEEKFDRLFVTAERDSYLTKPAGVELLSGTVEPIDFGSAVVNAKVTPTPTSYKASATTTETGITVTAGTQPSKLVSVATGLGKAILIGFVLLLVIVGVMSYLARRKSL
jgi:hypothetical protein